VTIFVLFSLALSASADELVMKHGGRIRGKIVAEDATTVEIETPGAGVQKIRKSEIRRIVRDPVGGGSGKKLASARPEYRRRAAELGKKDAEGHYELATWCRANGLRAEARKELELVLALDASHRGARVTLVRLLMKDDRRAAHQWVREVRVLVDARLPGPRGKGKERAAARLEKSIAENLEPLVAALGPETKVITGRSGEAVIRLNFRGKAEKRSYQKAGQSAQTPFPQQKRIHTVYSGASVEGTFTLTVGGVVAGTGRFSGNHPAPRTIEIPAWFGEHSSLLGSADPWGAPFQVAMAKSPLVPELARALGVVWGREGASILAGTIPRCRLLSPAMCTQWLVENRGKIDTLSLIEILEALSRSEGEWRKVAYHVSGELKSRAGTSRGRSPAEWRKHFGLPPARPRGAAAAPLEGIAVSGKAPTPVPLEGHESDILSLALSPDAKRLVTGSLDGEIRLWDLAGPRLVRTANPELGLVSALAISPDGITLVSGHAEGVLRLWNLGTGAEVRSLPGHEKRVKAVAFLGGTKRLASAGWDETLRIWRLDTGAQVHSLGGAFRKFESLAASRDGKWVVSGSRDGTIRILDVAAAKFVRTLKKHEARVSGVAVSADGQRFASASADGTVRLWERSTGRLLRTFEGHDSPVTCVVFSPDGSHLVSGGRGGTLRVWNCGNGKPGRVLRGHTSAVWGLAYGSDGTFLVSCSSDRKVLLWR
jgi:hypothetical protein